MASLALDAKTVGQLGNLLVYIAIGMGIAMLICWAVKKSKKDK
ncbi:MAG TPA: hypothetical protein VM389_12485 [Phycisphaerae bacterium]|nr:hypothetical protein [Phycisphaerae bacterium]HUU23343.1 hypothetical protein [Phycisphaerae bacterium]